MSDNELFGISEQLESSLCGHGKDHVGDSNKMVGDLISRAEAIDVIEAGRLTKLIDAETAVNGLKALPPAQPVAKDINVPAKDCISRAQAIEAIKEDKIDLTDPNVVAVFKATGDFEKVETQVMTCDRHIKILKDLPSAQQWIPCSERLPKEEIRDYWVCLEDGHQKQCRWMQYEKKDGHFYEWHSVMKVVAWMPLPPLPEPWKGEWDG